MPLNNLLNLSKYSRTALSREYLVIQNRALGKKMKFQVVYLKKNGKKIEVNNKENNLIFLKAPARYAYFMNEGLIIQNPSNKF